ncbi:hypothetical protein JL107_12825 [Nakamurella flavida]|uniref:Right-handed parallel beta-helix repeat-containing protein n=1 Tax=Nakamurella flavida TaxID=363630 RepID=A0A939C372_9ACTN|nr:hypothetical protein [Nakamurella flavida]MBM9477330.1 hypothetical protein [Nakamurella flavida]MDP9779786.1 hypothetical protein [Nakamurella flavida]
MKRRPARPGHRLTAGLLSATSLCVGLTLVCVPAASAAPDWTVVAQDSFARSVAGGWGTAEKGGPWALTNGGKAAVQVSGGAGSVAALPSGKSFQATLPAVSARDVRVQITTSFPSIGTGTWTVYQAVEMRRQADGSVYRGRIRMNQDGRAALSVNRVGPAGEVALESVDLPGTFRAGQRIVVQFEAGGTDPVAVNGRAWPEGTAMPYWQTEVRDSDPARIVRAGSAGTWEYASISGSAAVLTDDLLVSSADVPVPATPPVSSPAPVTRTATSAPASASAPASTAPATTAPATTAPATTAPATTAPAPPSPTITMIDPTSSAITPPTTPPVSTPPVSTPPVSTPPVSTPPVSTPPVSGARKPDAGNTGVPVGTRLSRYDGPLTITQDGTVIDGKEVYGDLRIQARNVVIRNSYLHCGSDVTPTNSGCIDANHANVFNLTIDRNTIDPDRPSYTRDGIVGHEFTARGNHILHTNDGIGIFNRPGGSSAANVRVEGNYIHDLTHWNDSPYHTDGTHNDGIEVQGGENIAIVGNTIIGSAVAGDGLGVFGLHAGSAIIVVQNVTPVKNLVIEKNWLDDAQNTVCIQQGKFATVELTMQDNQFGRNQYVYSRNSTYQIRIYSESRSTVHGLLSNTWMDNGRNLAVGRDSGIRYNGS